MLGAAPHQLGEMGVLPFACRCDLCASRFDDCLLDRHQTRNRPGGKDFRVPTCLWQQVLRLADLPHQSHPQRLLGADPLRGHQQPRRVLAADQLRHQIGRRRLRCHAEAGERALQLRRRRHEHQVRITENRCADAHSDTVDRADQGLREGGQGVDHVGKVALGGKGIGIGDARLHLIEVVARAERAPGAGEQHHRHRGIRGGRPQRDCHRAVQRFVECVENLGPVEGERAPRGRR